MDTNTPQSGYAPVNGLNMYYEIHGTGQPLILLHGAFMTIELLGDLVSRLAETRQVIAVEFQAHGHTADIERPLRYESLADDTAALMGHLGIEQADVFGYSLGAGVALQLTLRHPRLLRKLVFVSGSYTSAGWYPEVMAAIAHITPDVFIGTPWHDAYTRAAPNPDAFPALVEKMKRLDGEEFDWQQEKVRAIAAPTFIVIGDSDGTLPEHAVEMFRLLGGGVFGDLAGLPASRLAILPGTSHVGIINRTDWLAPMTAEFLDAPMPEPR